MTTSHSYTWAEAAEILGTSVNTLSQFRQGDEIVMGGRRLPCYTFGGRRWFVAKAEMARFLGEPIEQVPVKEPVFDETRWVPKDVWASQNGSTVRGKEPNPVNRFSGTDT